jgi:hypothetical protein
MHVRFQVLKAASMKKTVFCVVSPLVFAVSMISSLQATSTSETLINFYTAQLPRRQPFSCIYFSVEATAKKLINQLVTRIVQ